MEAGTRLGPYEIREQLGAGGMGEVYLAADSRLGRDVAIKILPAEFAADPERLARFELEARAAAALSHPNIAVVHDVGAADVDGASVHYLVQEFLQGRTLRDALADGPMSLKRVLAVSGEIARALAAAHAAGIVHRDLKPENIFLTSEGHAKVLDFGLAKLIEASPAPAADATMSPTVLGTMAGQIMGTVGYMAPEQVRGEPVDRRTDLFSLGCVLFEMASGTRAFAGSSLHETLHMIGHAPAPVLRDTDASLPPQLDELLDKLLEKEPADRYQHADDVAVDLARLARRVDAGAVDAATPAAAPAAAEPARRGLAPAAILAAVALVATLVAAWALSRESNATLPVIRASIPIPGLGYSRSGDGRAIAIAPDGRSMVAFTLHDGEEQVLFREFDSDGFDEVAVPGLSLNDPAFSPDGESVAYRTTSGVDRISPASGTVQPLATLPGLETGAVWTRAGELVASTGAELVVVPATGAAEPRVVARASGGDRAEFRWPSMLPSGTQVLVVQTAFGLSRTPSARAEIVVVDLNTGEVTPLGIEGSSPLYVNTGHLVYSTRRQAVVVPFDAETLTVQGQPHVLPETIGVDGFGLLMMSVADNGNMIYVPQDAWAMSELVWVDRSGAVASVDFVQGQNLRAIADPRISPDGLRITLSSDFDIWAADLPSRTMTRIAAGSGQSFYPIWAGDTTRVLYAAERSGPYEVYARVADSSASEELVFSSPNALRTVAWIDAFDEVLVREQTPEAGMNILAAPLSGLDQGRIVLAGEYDEIAPDVSPDGRWIAYTTNETGRDEVWVTAFSEGGRRIQVSQDGGREPLWGPDSSELFYWDGHSFHSARVTADPDLRVSARELLFEKTFIRYRWHAQYDVHPDGDRFLMVGAIRGDSNVRLVTNWASTLEALTGSR